MYTRTKIDVGMRHSFRSIRPGLRVQLQTRTLDWTGKRSLRSLILGNSIQGTADPQCVRLGQRNAVAPVPGNIDMRWGPQI